MVLIHVQQCTVIPPCPPPHPLLGSPLHRHRHRPTQRIYHRRRLLHPAASRHISFSPVQLPRGLHETAPSFLLMLPPHITTNTATTAAATAAPAAIGGCGGCGGGLAAPLHSGPPIRPVRCPLIPSITAVAEHGGRGGVALLPPRPSSVPPISPVPPVAAIVVPVTRRGDLPVRGGKAAEAPAQIVAPPPQRVDEVVLEGAEAGLPRGHLGGDRRGQGGYVRRQGGDRRGQEGDRREQEGDRRNT